MLLLSFEANPIYFVGVIRVKEFECHGRHLIE
jgi:hypothetical protein